jgi:hypothetical protein
VESERHRLHLTDMKNILDTPESNVIEVFGTGDKDDWLGSTAVVAKLFSWLDMLASVTEKSQPTPSKLIYGTYHWMQLDLPQYQV